MKEYQVIQPPFSTLNTHEMTKATMKEYYRWFITIIPERISILADAVITTPGYEGWLPDYAPDSLLLLGSWFLDSVEVRPRTTQEKEDICAGGAVWFGPAGLEDWELTNRTFSLAIDVGMYMGEVAVKNVPELQWKQILTGSKRYVDYGQPVIGPLLICDYNPVGNMLAIAYGHVRQSRKERDLRVIYDSVVARVDTVKK